MWRKHYSGKAGRTMGGNILLLAGLWWSLGCAAQVTLADAGGPPAGHQAATAHQSPSPATSGAFRDPLTVPAESKPSTKEAARPRATPNKGDTVPPSRAKETPPSAHPAATSKPNASPPPVEPRPMASGPTAWPRPVTPHRPRANRYYRSRPLRRPHYEPGAWAARRGYPHRNHSRSVGYPPPGRPGSRRVPPGYGPPGAYPGRAPAAPQRPAGIERPASTPTEQLPTSASSDPTPRAEIPHSAELPPADASPNLAKQLPASRQTVTRPEGGGRFRPPNLEGSP